MPGWDVRSATLSMPGRLEEVAEDGALIYPFFMSKGWFTTKVLPKRLGNIQARIADPFGLDPALASLAADALRAEAAASDWPLDEVDILLAAHGSARGRHAAAAAFQFAKALATALPGPRINCGFVEQSPSIAAAAALLPSQCLCLPFFAQAGDHVRDDIPASLAKANFPGRTLPVLGALPGAARLIANALLDASADPG
ncbi:cobalamin biosynthesis protein CbiX [Epibacterium ulvae]|nr:cobalamin biosynthesis protein CbiX [Epibacterium ulvae]